jgi:hypothetical protein
MSTRTGVGSSGVALGVTLGVGVGSGRVAMGVAVSVGAAVAVAVGRNVAVSTGVVVGLAVRPGVSVAVARGAAVSFRVGVAVAGAIVALGWVLVAVGVARGRSSSSPQADIVTARQNAQPIVATRSRRRVPHMLAPPISSLSCLQRSERERHTAAAPRVDRPPSRSR